MWSSKIRFWACARAEPNLFMDAIYGSTLWNLWRIQTKESSESGQELKASVDHNVFFYACREPGPGCVPKDKDAGDTSDVTSISSGDKITLPNWLTAGDYVLQWMWQSAGHRPNSHPETSNTPAIHVFSTR